MRIHDASIRVHVHVSLLRVPGCLCLCRETLEEGSLTVSPDGRLDASPSHVGVQVILRCRPLLPREVAEGAQSVLTCRRNEVRDRVGVPSWRTLVRVVLLPCLCMRV